MLQRTKPLENLAQHCNIVTRTWRHIWRHQKCRLQTKTDNFNKSFPKENHDTASQCWKNKVHKRTETV